MRSNFNFYNMKTIILISCAAKKAKEKSKAEDLYISPLFKKSLAYAKTLTTTDNIYILSAKHHLLPLDKVIAPYDVSLKKDITKEEDRLKWGEKVIEELKKVADIEKDKFIILAGKDYVKPIKDRLVNVELPFDGVRGNGEMLQRLNKEEEKIWMAEQEILKRKLEDLNKKVQGINITGETTETSVYILHELFNILKRFTFPYKKRIGKKWIVPRNGIYIFFEKGETITTPDGRILDRIVRVGTHEKDNRLFSRMDQHFKQNIKASSFRKYIGDALQNKAQQSLTDIEKDITTYMTSNLSFVVFEIKTESQRLFWEEKLIATLSQAAKKKIIELSKDWLGNYSSNSKIQESGLWQDQKLNHQELTLKELKQLLQNILFSFVEDVNHGIS